MIRRLLILIWLGLGGLLFGQPVWALECEAPTLYYNGENEQLYAEPDRGADTEFLAWGTEACPIGTHGRWLRVWTEVRLENGDTGWLDQDDLLTVDAFGDVTLARHGALRGQLQDLIIEIARIEVRLKELDREVLDATLQDVLKPWLQDGPVAESNVDETTTKPPTTDLNAVWQAQDYTVVKIEDYSFGRRIRYGIGLVAPDAVTREQRLATLMAEALRAYRQREIEDAAILTLWPSDEQVAPWLLAQITFAADRCGWAGDDCQTSHWSWASAGTAVFTEEQLRIELFLQENSRLFHEPKLALNEEGQPISQAGWACYEPVDIPADGACYTRGGLLLEDEDEVSCTRLKEWGDLWLRADEEWGYLDTGCAEDHLNRYAASQLDLDLATVEENFIAMVREDNRIGMDIPRELEQQQDFKR